jgi:hypothetical protein
MRRNLETFPMSLRRHYGRTKKEHVALQNKTAPARGANAGAAFGRPSGGKASGIRKIKSQSANTVCSAPDSKPEKFVFLFSNGSVKKGPLRRGPVGSVEKLNLAPLVLFF